MDVTVPPWGITVILSNILLIQLLLQPSGIFPKRWFRYFNPHCKDIVPKIRNKYSQKWNCAASFPIPTLRIRSKVGGPIIGIYKLLTVSFLGIHKSDLVCSAAYLHAWLSLFSFKKILFFTFQIEDPFFLFMGSGPIVTIELNVSTA